MATDMPLSRSIRLNAFFTGLKDQPGNVRNNESILIFLLSMLEISWK
jgi:hypothetical protein